MEIILISFFILTGSFCAFLSSAKSFVSNGKLTDFVNKNNNIADKGDRLKTSLEDSENALYFLEIILYIAATMLAGRYIYTIEQNFFDLFYGFITVSTLILFLRILLQSLGKRYSNIVIKRFYGLIQLITKLMKPLAWLNNYISLKLTGIDPEEASRGQLNAMIESTHEEGSLDLGEYRILKNIMKFGNVLVSDVMTPRTVIFSCDSHLTVAEALKMPELQMYSRFPIWEGESFDNGVIGYVLSRDIFEAALAGHTEKQLREFKREVYFIPENAELDKALDMFLSRRQHLFVAVDEYGGIEGLLTMEDVLETLLGVEIVDEVDRIVDLREYAKQKRDKRVASIGKTNEVRNNY